MRVDAERLTEAITDAVETVLNNHHEVNNGTECRCGVLNNMDGDVVHSHIMSEFESAVRTVVVSWDPVFELKRMVKARGEELANDHSGDPAYAGGMDAAMEQVWNVLEGRDWTDDGPRQSIWKKWYL
ncbi:recombination directionality factor [Mycobacterium phage Nhonho]|uniref:recombination directionality factor n=1 Tax=Mycobacterium phage Nhonho TaxID=1675553 RepID=UPI0006A2714F|nr:recombination directionality factor [Mycobacterium phage Nhonho]AKU45469.1 hypothetical protein NHONHO_73 [Mycobacterium phage Nhonho]